MAQGCVYALVALGFVLIYKATETVNFAQGDLMMLGGFFALTASVMMGWPYWATILFAVAAMAAVGMLIDRHHGADPRFGQGLESSFDGFENSAHGMAIAAAFKAPRSSVVCATLSRT